MINGRCECGRVQYRVEGELVDLCHCHCSICRHLHGAPFVTWGGIKRDDFNYTSGEENLKTYPFSENSDSLFCGNCGSRILVDCKPETHMLYITLGSVNGDINCPAGFHQFVGSKAPWYEITDDLPQYDEWPDPV